MKTATSVASVGDSEISRNPATTNSGTTTIIAATPARFVSRPIANSCSASVMTLIASSMRPRNAVRAELSG